MSLDRKIMKTQRWTGDERKEEWLQPWRPPLRNRTPGSHTGRTGSPGPSGSPAEGTAGDRVGPAGGQRGGRAPQRGLMEGPGGREGSRSWHLGHGEPRREDNRKRRPLLCSPGPAGRPLQAGGLFTQQSQDGTSHLLPQGENAKPYNRKCGESCAEGLRVLKSAGFCGLPVFRVRN